MTPLTANAPGSSKLPRSPPNTVPPHSQVTRSRHIEYRETQWAGDCSLGLQQSHITSQPSQRSLKQRGTSHLARQKLSGDMASQSADANPSVDSHGLSEETVAPSIYANFSPGGLFRQGAPGMLPLFPVVSQQLSEGNPLLPRAQELIALTTEQLVANNVQNFETPVLCHRLSQYGKKRDRTETIVVFANYDSSGAQWEAAIIRIREKFVSMGLPDLSIEIVDRRTCINQNYLPISSKDNDEVRNWEKARARIRQLLTGRTDCLSVVLLRANPPGLTKVRPITVVVTMHEDGPKTNDDWVQLRRRIKSICHEEDCLDFEVDLSAGAIIPYQRSTCWYQGYVKQPPMGMSISPSNEAGCGTLGGYFRLQDSTGQQKVFGITCWHVAALGQPAIKHTGLSVQQASQIGISIMQPARADIEAIHSLEASMISAETAYLNKHRERILSRTAGEFEKYDFHLMALSIPEKERALDRLLTTDRSFGDIFCGSGIKIKDVPEHPWLPRRCVMDWALIAVRPDRLGTNTMENLVRALPEDLPIESFSAPSYGVPVFKCGRATGGTTALVNGFTADRFHHDTVTLEATAHSLSTQFAAQGDSGAFVVSVERQAVGMIFEGNPSLGITFFMSMPAIIRDIEEVTDCKVVGLA